MGGGVVGRERVLCGPLPFSVCAIRFLCFLVSVVWGSGCDGRVGVSVTSCARYVCNMEGVEEPCVRVL